MNLPSGIYIDDSMEPAYLGCSDSFLVDDNTELFNEKLETTIDNYIPDVINESDYRVFNSILVDEISQIDANSNLITKCYDLENMDNEMTYKLSSLYNIEYPLTYSIDRLKLLIKNYEKIRRVRGTEKSIKMLFRILERSESELYAEDSDDTIVTMISPGYYQIYNSRIVDTEFASYMLRKVLRSGIQFVLNSEYERIYTMSARTTIRSIYNYNSVTDSTFVKDDTKSNYNALVTDRSRGFIETYPY